MARTRRPRSCSSTGDSVVTFLHHCFRRCWPTVTRISGPDILYDAGIVMGRPVPATRVADEHDPSARQPVERGAQPPHQQGINDPSARTRAPSVGSPLCDQVGGRAGSGNSEAGVSSTTALSMSDSEPKMWMAA